MNLHFYSGLKMLKRNGRTSQFIIVGAVAFIAVFLCLHKAFATGPVAPPEGIIYEKVKPSPNPALLDQEVQGTLEAYIKYQNKNSEEKAPTGTTYKWIVKAVNGNESSPLKADVTVNPDNNDTLVWKAKFAAAGDYEITFHVTITNAGAWTAPVVAEIIVKFAVRLARPSEATFAGVNGEFYDVLEDKPAGPPEYLTDGPAYSAPHWKDANNDGDAEDNGDRRFPIAYVRNTKIHLTIVLRVNALGVAALPAATVKIRGSQDGGGVIFPATNGAYNGANTELSATIESTNTLPNTVKYLAPFKINWEVSANGINNWKPCGSTDNRVYVLLAVPVAGITLYETILDIACRNQDGQTVEATLADNIFDTEFKPKKLTKKAMDGHNVADGAKLVYWDNDVMVAQQAGVTWGTPNKLLKHNKGTCDAFNEMFVRALQAHGIDVAIQPIKPNLPRPIPFILPPGWAELVVGGVPMQEMAVKANLRGQNNVAPGFQQSYFFDHAVTDYNNTIYDPSYGEKYAHAVKATRQNAWETASIEGFSYMLVKTVAPELGRRAPANPGIANNPAVLQTQWP